MTTSPSGIKTAINSKQEAQNYHRPSDTLKTASKMDDSEKTTASPSLSGSSLNQLAPENHNPSVEQQQPDVEKATPKTAASPLDWEGPEDPDNPLNWSSFKRHYHIVPPAALSFTT